MATSSIDRRELLKQGFIWGGAGTAAAAAVLVPAAAARAGSRPKPASDERETLVLDVSCLADTFRLIPAPDPSPPVESPLWAAPFLVEGLIFEGGALSDKQGFDPRSEIDQAIGTWLCRGSLLLRDDRSQPVGANTQYYLFPRLAGAPEFPTDQLFCEGLGGAEFEGWAAPRAVLGGTGRYAGARGVVVESQIGTNATTSGAGAVMPAGPNFRFEFELFDAGS